MHAIHWQASIDYLRITYPDSETCHYPALRRALRRAIAETDGSYTERENVKLMQYYGTAFDSGFCGVSEGQGLLLQASGYTAHSLAMHLPIEPYAIPRLDLQITVWLAEDVADLAQQANATHMARRSTTERQPLPRLVIGNGSGDTFYAGSRGGSGSAYLRLYDKWRESGKDVYRNAWRYEVELTNRKALPAFTQLKQADFGQQECAEIVRHYAHMRLVDVPSIDGIKPYDSGFVPKEKTTDESRLRWLETAVAPALAGLVKRGYNPAYLDGLMWGVNRAHMRLDPDILDEC